MNGVLFSGCELVPISTSRTFDRSVWHLLRDFIPHVPARRRRQLFGLFVLMLVSAMTELLTIGAVIPFISLLADPSTAYSFPSLQGLFSSLGWQRPEDIVTPMTVLFLMLVISASAIRMLFLWTSNRYIFALGYDVGVQLYGRVLGQPYSFHVAHNTSQIIAAVNKVQGVINGAVKPLLEGIIALILSTTIIGALLYIQPVATAVATITLTAAYLLVGRLVRLRLQANGRVAAAAQSRRIRAIQEGLGGIRDVILDNSRKQITRVYAKVDQKLRRALSNNAILNQVPRHLIEAIAMFMVIGLAWFLATRPEGLLSALPVLGALALGAQRLLPQLQRIYGAWARMTGSHQLFADVMELLELPRNEGEGLPETSDLTFKRGIRLENVGFRYEGGHEQVLQSLHLDIPRGSSLGIAGQTGSGKTTLADIIMGLLQPMEGRILVDEVPIDASNRRQWRQFISHVPQHIFLVDASIAENIAFGLPAHEIDMNRVRHAAKCACIANFIDSHPHGYQARVGERGIQLSGGQRQRIGIARAIYRHTEVLVLDEATSALDMATEMNVLNAISSINANLTIIVIAHRLHTIENYDRVIHLGQGSIIDAG